MKPSFSSQECVFYCIICTLKGEICPIYNAFLNFKAIYLGISSGRQSKQAVFSKLEKHENLLGIGIFPDLREYKEGGDQTPLRTMSSNPSNVNLMSFYRNDVPVRGYKS